MARGVAKHAGGRPRVGVGNGKRKKYEDRFVEQGYKLALLGLTEEQIADVFGVHVASIAAWVKWHPAFGKALREGKIIADSEVAAALYERAKGYSHEAVKIFMPPGAKEPVYAPYVEHYAPDTSAALGWLKARHKDLWNVSDDQNVKVTLTLEQLVLQAHELRAAEARVIEHEPASVIDRGPGTDKKVD
jgi:hypothetical protein